jgi:general stress protein 26
MTDTTTSDRQHVADLVSRAEVAMLTTMTQEGKHVSRPMGLQEAEFSGDLWFFAYDDSAKAAPIRVHPGVNVSFSDTKSHSWTSIAGRAQIVHDRQKAEQLYSPTLQAWLSDGPETPGLTLIKIEADTAEYWEGPTSTVAFVAGHLRAATTGNPGTDPIRNDTVEL